MEGQKITIQNGKLQVPNFPIIPFIEGDGTGPDIWKAAVKVVENAVEKAYKGAKKIVWKEVMAGEKSFKLTGDWLPKETLDTFREYLVGIKGPLTTPVGGGIRSLNVALRQELDLYACVRPVRWFKGVPSPVLRPEQCDMTVFRENTEDIYVGIEWEAKSESAKKIINFIENELGQKGKIRFPESSSIGIKPVSIDGTERLVRAALEFCFAQGKPSLTLVHKGNIMKYTEGGFKKWGYELAEREYGDRVFTWNQYEKIKAEKGQAIADEAQKTALAAGKLLVKDSIADAFLQQILLRPAEYSVIATLNLNGDYVSDALAAIVGGIGIAPGANINYNTGYAIFEATHGTAPKYAGLDKVNPGSVILSATMMLEYMGWQEAADLIYKGLEAAINAKRVTYDFARLMDGATEIKCSEFGQEVINKM